MTGFESDWKHFFELRCDTAAHPDARKLALELYNKLYKMIEIRNINPEFETMRPTDDTVGDIRFGEN